MICEQCLSYHSLATNVHGAVATAILSFKSVWEEVSFFSHSKTKNTRAKRLNSVFICSKVSFSR